MNKKARTSRRPNVSKSKSDTRKAGTSKEPETTTGVRQPPPKKTGKRGIGPALDPKADFENATTKPGSEAEAQVQGTTQEAEETSEAKGSLLAEQPPKAMVVGSRFEVHYLKPTFSKTTEGKRLIAFHMVLPLTEAHTEDSLLPKRIQEDWSLMTKNGRTKLELNGIPGQRVQIFLSSDAPDDDDKLTLPSAKVTNVSLAVVQKKGDGEAKKVIRLQFRLQVPVSHEVAEFAETNYGNNFWITLEETDEPLFDEED